MTDDEDAGPQPAAWRPLVPVVRVAAGHLPGV